MTLTALIDALSSPDAYPHPADVVEVHQTHISVVFLAGPFAYKIKKPVNLGFLDFSTLDKRKHFCEEEVRLNRRLAPQVYFGVVPIPASLHIGGAGPIIDWAVQMKRLPAEATLESRLGRGEVTPEQICKVAQRIASFHKSAERNDRIAGYGRFAVVAQNARDNFTQTTAQVGGTVRPAVFERVRTLTEAHLAKNHDLIEDRAAQGVPCDTHGDLHLDHVYLFPEAAPPDDLLMIDCIEFADRFRFADPIADTAFLAMDLKFHGRRDLARVFTDAYIAASGDDSGRALVPFYTAYRAVVRAKVEGMELGEKEIDPNERRKAEQQAKTHWLVALSELAEPAERPALVMMAGLPGSGKSTLARRLAAEANFVVLRSDVVRKQLAGAADSSPAEFGAGIYSDAWTDRTYAELLRQCEERLEQGERVIIDANFRDDHRRREFLDAARRWGVPCLFIHCQAPREVVRRRLQARRNDASDADWRIYECLEQSWEPIGAETQAVAHVLDTSGSIEENAQHLHAILRGHVA